MCYCVCVVGGYPEIVKNGTIKVGKMCVPSGVPEMAKTTPKMLCWDVKLRARGYIGRGSSVGKK